MGNFFALTCGDSLPSPQNLLLCLLKQEIKQMASDINFVQFIVDQIGISESIRYKKMFGEYAIYYNDKVVALVCNDQLFVKQTNAGKSFIGNVVEAPAYPGAKPSFLIEDQLDDNEWLSKLIALTEQELPTPKSKNKSKKIVK
jgi:TfoX/Sxy family transcriptional regulator of competence genes